MRNISTINSHTKQTENVINKEPTINKLLNSKTYFNQEISYKVVFYLLANMD